MSENVFQNLNFKKTSENVFLFGILFSAVDNLKTDFIGIQKLAIIQNFTLKLKYG